METAAFRTWADTWRPAAGLAFALLLAAAGCGGEWEPAVPTAPSRSVPAPSTGATISGVANGARASAPAGAADMTVTVAGTDIAAPVAASGTFALKGVPPGDIALQFTGPDVSAATTIRGVDTQEQIRIVVTLRRSTAAVESLARTGRGAADLQGRVTAVDHVGRTLLVAHTTVSVPREASIRHGGVRYPFDVVTPGTRLRVTGRMDGTLAIAEQITLQGPRPAPAP